MGKNWIKDAVKNHKGSLRRTAGVKKGETIPEEDLDELVQKPGVTGRRARMAKTLRHMKKK